MAALGAARKRARIVTPYFLPNEALSSALEAAIHRGIDVEIIVPRRSNLFFFDWPMAAVFEHLVPRGARVHLAEPPFDHTKIFLVDETWCSIGSSNWDDRSLRLNFELNLEVNDERLARQLHAIVDDKRARARPLTGKQVRGVALPVRLRNRFARLFSPYL
jgi:cardiolipin synthase